MTEANFLQASLSINSISCERDERILFKNLSFRCDSGSLLQILGFNGAGKTTLLHTLCGLRPAAEGEIQWLGTSILQNLAEYRRSLFFLGHQAPVKGHLTVRENVEWLKALHGSNPSGSVDDALEQVDLGAYSDTACYSLSAGQRRRVALAQLYLNQCPLWVLDEPFTAIDKAGVSRLSERISEHSERGGIVVLTSHQPIELSDVNLLDISRFQPSPEEQLYCG
ncbi:cytochrome c biogenesis heme-transporting ATPase CcmA [Gilvimarinus sp. SDUM040013]|uniref:Cytochrome c biogenesis heme-transporting ATPase CcmA n=2 Tax=Gilvimarinus gilvus TaxID=3058038 RepID=A0ABU4S1Z7_9GAMM|nr:cytochrome c biogenesis heme-transporting ATPase CcmA [Gilvimarinus sp. SDUM040013]MDX6851173.1 cytochrome c biogenesis heme-transporting ATPase CcmA [Gilvimarinus sp. SDUM040013]